MARFYPSGGGNSASGGSNIDLDQITVPRSLVAAGYKTITNDSTGEIVEGTLEKIHGNVFGGSDTVFDNSPIKKAAYNTIVGGFDFELNGYFDNTNDNIVTRVHIPNCIPANIAAGIKVGGKDGYINGTFTSDATASAEDIRIGKTAYVNGQLITGTAIIKTATLTTGRDFVVKINISSALHFMRSMDPPTVGIVTTDISENEDKSVITWYDEPSRTQYWYSDADLVYLNENSSGMFYMDGSSSTPWIETLDMSEFDTSKVTDMSFMFKECWKLASLDVSNFNTSNVTNMSYMFDGCDSLTSLDVSNWDTSKVNNTYRMFGYCMGLTSLDVSGWNTTNITTMGAMFSNCQSLTSLDVSNWDTSKVKYMNDLFGACTNLTSLDLSSFNTSNVTDMNGIFFNCKSLNSLNVSNFNTSKVLGMYRMFSSCEKLSSPLDLSNFDTSNVTNMSYMFDGCSAPSIIYGNTFLMNDTLYYSALVDDNSNKLYKMFNDCQSNKPTGDRWDNGIWTDIGTFIGASTLTTGNNIINIINKSMTSFLRTATAPANDIVTTDISKDGNGSIVTWYDGSTTTQYYYSESNIIYMNEDSSYMFNGCKSLTSLDLSDFNTSKVTNMQHMFVGCSSLTSLNIGNFDTSNVTNMMSMFSNCKSLTSLNVSNFNTSKVVNMYGMFFNCIKLTSLDVSNFDTSKVTEMSSMFSDCSSLASLNVSHFDTSNIKTMITTFTNCASLISLDLSNWNTSNILIMRSTFDGCTSLTSLNISNWNTSNTNEMYRMFYNCSSLTSLNISSFDTSKVTIMSDMFYNCTGLSTITYGSNFILPDEIYNTCSKSSYDNQTSQMMNSCPANKPTGGNWDLGDWSDSGTFIKAATLTTGLVFNNAINKSMKAFSRSTLAPDVSITTTDISKDGDGYIVTWYDKASTTQYYYTPAVSIYMNEYSGSMFAGCYKLTSLDVSSFNTYNVTNMVSMFYGCKSLTTLDLSNFNTSNVTNMNNMFDACSRLTSLNVSSFDTSKVTNMMSMFENCNSLTVLDLSNFDTSNVTNMGAMFFKCTGLTQLDVSNFNTSNVTNMNSMFYSCKALTSLDVSHFNTSKVTDMNGMFYNCQSLTSLDVSNFDTSKVADIGGMFNNCISLTSLNVSSFDTSNATNMNGMFHDCSSLTSLDLSHFNTSNVTNMYSMFNNCISLTSLNVSNFDTFNVTNMGAMFYACEKLSDGAIIYGPNFILSDISLMTCSRKNTNCTMYMYSNCPANKPTGGNWDLGTWESSDSNMYGSFISETPLLPSSAIVPTLNKSATKFVRSLSEPTDDVIAEYLTKSVHIPVRTWYDEATTTQYWYTKAATIYMNASSGNMFQDLASLESIDLSGWDSSRVTDMERMFYGCKSLKSLDLSAWDTSIVKDMSSMFTRCELLTSISYGSNFVLSDYIYSAMTATIGKRNYTAYMYQNCPANKPTGGNWDLGTWEAGGGFIPN